MAVVAEKDTLLEFASQRFPTSVMASGKVEALRLLASVMEGQRSKAPCVSTELAATSSFLNETPLQRLAIDAEIATARIALALRVPSAVVVLVHAPALDALAPQRGLEV
jgi:hypothetical protein